MFTMPKVGRMTLALRSGQFMGEAIDTLVCGL